MAEIRIKRVYEAPTEDDGFRVLVDRLWPRGISKEHAALADWWKDIAPSPELRKWFGHKEENFGDFSSRYMAELEHNPAASPFVRHIGELLKAGNVTLLFGAKSPTCNHAVILKNWILAKL